ncbi:Ig-like domain-containing protein [Halomonas sp. BMC6]|uniref:Ig-like domain-containing protein n=1 Tax=Halomonas sp. BMC6 TaxID=3073244 RepID=UPI0030D0C77C
MTVDIVEESLALENGEVTTSDVTFTFSEAVQGFDLNDVTVVGGSVTNLSGPVTNEDGSVTYTATFTPDAEFEGTASVSVADDSYTDVAGNPGTGGSDTVAVDVAGPSLTVDIVEESLALENGEVTTSDVTFTFSEAVQGFDLNDVTVVGGSVTNLSGPVTNEDGSVTYTATFTPDAEFEGTASVSVADDSYTDVAGNPGTGGSDEILIDTNTPPVAIDDYADSTGLTEIFTESFEDGEIKGRWQILDDYNNWTLTNDIEIQNAGVTVEQASDGSRLAELDPNRSTKISREIDTDLGKTYTLTFDYQARPGHLADSAMKVTFGNVTFEVSTDNDRVVTVSGNNSDQVTSDSVEGGWTRISLDIEANSSESMLAFKDLGQPNSFGALLDNIRVFEHGGGDTPFEVKAGESITFDPADLLSNDSDADGDDLIITNVFGALGGEVFRNTDGDITFTANSSGNGPAQFQYTVSDGKGGLDTAKVYLNVLEVDSVPTSTGGYAIGNEDSSNGENDDFLLKWEDFNIVDSDANSAGLGIIITKLPEDGVLQFKGNGGEWQDINDSNIGSNGFEFSKSQIDDGVLRFKPVPNESGFDGYGGNGVGDQQADYAQFSFKPIDSQVEGEETIFTVDVKPVADTPIVKLEISKGELIGDSDGEIIQVNGGSGQAGGFDIQGGNIVAIGSGVRVWGTVDLDGKNPSGQPVDNLAGIKIPDGADASSVLLAYGNANGGTNANSTAQGLTDIFILNENSGYFKDNNHWASMDAFTGNRGAGHSPDYVFIDATSGHSYDISGWTNTRNGQINTYENVNISGVVKGPNHIEAIFDGNGLKLPPAGPKTTEVTTTESTGNFQEFLIEVSALLTDKDGSEVLSNITLTRVPMSATLELLSAPDSVTLVKSSDGQWVLNNPAGKSLQDIQLQLTVPADTSDFELKAEATATEVGGDGNALEGIEPAIGFASANVSVMVLPELDYPDHDTSVSSPIESIWAQKGDGGGSAFKGSGNFNQFNATELITKYGYGVEQNPQNKVVEGEPARKDAIQSNEELMFVLSEPVSRFIFSVHEAEGEKGKNSLEGRYELLDADRKVVAEGTFDNDGQVSIETGKNFKYVLISGEASGNKTGFFIEIEQVGDITLTPAAGGKVEGSGGDDTLMGGAVDDTLFGGAGSDLLIGGDGDDILFGGAGNDSLVGGAGNDTFLWKGGDQGQAGAPALDLVQDFGTGSNTLDLSDLLQGESEGTIDSFIIAKEEGDDTLLYISSKGELNGNIGNADQVIHLEGQSLNDLGGASSNSLDVIQHMINNGKLDIE